MKSRGRVSVLEPALAARIRRIWESARTHAARTVSTSHVCANWLVGQQIVEAEQGGASRAGYGEQLIERLSRRLSKELGSGFSVSGLRYMRLFYLAFPGLLPIHHALRDESGLRGARRRPGTRIHHAVRDESSTEESIERALLLPARSAGDGESWKPGELHPHLSWSH